MAKQEKGKLVVIEGSDGSGKETQSRKLVKHLEINNIPNFYIDFPRYQTSMWGEMVGRYLQGEFGAINEIHPQLASILYAGDRLSAKGKIEEALVAGKIVVANRYVGSNLAHQSAKYEDIVEQELFINWLEKLEYEENEIPREDGVLFLYMPYDVAQELKIKQRITAGEKADIHEADADFLRKSVDQFLLIANRTPHWTVIECAEDGEPLPIEMIHQKILTALEERGLLMSSLQS